jgi:electron transfer flavoprotein alpha subunit
MSSGSVLVISELRDAVVRDETYELIGAARKLADAGKHDVVVLIAGSHLGEQAAALASRGADRVLCADDASLANYSLDLYRAVALTAAQVCDARFVLMSATPTGWDLAPRLAVRLDAGFVSSVTGVDTHDEGISFRRRVFGGKLETRVVSRAERTVLTLDAGACDPFEGSSAASIEVLAVDLPTSPRSRFVERRSGDSSDVDLTKADVIVSGGRGVGDAEKFTEVIVPLAEVLGAAVGASRPVVDAGWLPRAHQVGLSGQVVKPKVYIACGISGAVQHLAGMKNSNFIIAINRDARAPIYQVADLAVVADLHEVLPALTRALKERRQA